jgi:hypothetical protein
MRSPSVALAVAFSVAVALTFASPAVADKPADKSSDHGAKPVVAGPSGAETSTALVIARAAESNGAKQTLSKAPQHDAGGNSAVPPGRRCDPNDPRPGCQPLPKSPKK